MRERFIRRYELVGARCKEVWWLASKGSESLEGVFMVRGPIEGCA